MTPGSELDRLFGRVLQSIPKPVDPAAAWTAAAECMRNNKLKFDPNRIDGEEISDKALELIRAAIAKATGGESCAT